MKTLIVVDMQNDFVTGSLGTEEARAIVPNVKRKIREYANRGDQIIVTQDTHYDNYLDTYEGKMLPIVHCKANSDGWQIVDEVYCELKKCKNVMYILKHTFGSLELINRMKQLLESKDADEVECCIELVGLDLDICVISNAVLLKTAFPNAQISVDLANTAASSNEAFEATKKILDSLQIIKYE